MEIIPKFEKLILNFDGNQLDRDIYVCSCCKKIWKSLRDLNTHLGGKKVNGIKRKQRSDKIEHKCETCNRQFKSNHFLNLHKKIHDEPNDEEEKDPNLFYCDECICNFKTKRGLAIHKAKHKKL